MRPEPLLRRFGQTVRALRRSKAWSRQQLAKRAQLSVRFLADVETGQGNPSLLRIDALAAALDTTPHALMAAAANQQNREVISLLGLRGAGKSTVGQALAQRLRVPFLELDLLVEQAAGLTLPQVFEVHGEQYFRRLELEALRALLQEPGTRVVATGGGIVTSPEALALLEAHTHTVWLRAEPLEHWTRVQAQGDLRPMANQETAFTALCRILAEREPLYRRAQHVIETSGRSVDAIVAELEPRLAEVQRSSAEPPSPLRPPHAGVGH